MTIPSLCKNCHQPIENVYCGYCGQKITKPIKAKRVFLEIWDHFLQLDFKLVKTTRELITRPGRMIDEYLSGKRSPYTNPFKLLFISATIHFIFIQFFDIQLGGFGKEEQKMGLTVAAALNYLFFIFLIIPAVVFKWLYAKKNLNVSEAYVAVCFIWSGYLLIGIPFGLIAKYLDIHSIYMDSMIALIYYLYVTRQLFQIGLLTSIWKSILFHGSYVLSTSLITGAMIAVAYLFGYDPLLLSPKG